MSGEGSNGVRGGVGRAGEEKGQGRVRKGEGENSIDGREGRCTESHARQPPLCE